MNELVTPLYYTEREGGEWQSWRAGAIDLEELTQKRVDGLNHIVLNGVLLHSLAFGDISAGWGGFPRWDALNGWTTRLVPEKVKDE